MSKESFYNSTLGKKVIVALTGAGLFGFVLTHMTGNLKMFFGHDSATGRFKMDLYAEFLRDFGSEMFGHGGFLWIARIALLGMLVLHVICVIQLSLRNKKAKTSQYENQQYDSANYASRSMIIGGPLILAFIIYHILHFTTGDLHTSNFVHGAVYSNVYSAFQSTAVVMIYLAAMLLLAMHLYHGIWSMTQTLGIDNPEWNTPIRVISKVLALVISLGFAAVPLSVAFGLLQAP
ncbi:MAG: succinate dehydrogenase cytochrome b subunit [Bdellovibrionales bacterium]|nr:succinate dehydrogenase cytochrome b subunit [Bdellovibrionales bacterium]